MHFYQQPIDLPFKLPTRIYFGMLVIWLLRPNLQKRFPLHKNNQKTYLQFLAWCAAIGRREYVLLQGLEEWNSELQQPIKLPILIEDQWQGTFSVGMYLVGLHRARYWESQVIANKILRHRAASWYFREGRQLIHLEHIPPWQINALVTNFSGPEQFLKNLSSPKVQTSSNVEILKKNNADIIHNWYKTKTAPRESSDLWVVNSNCSLSQLLARFLPIKVNWLFAVKRALNKKPTTVELTQVICQPNFIRTSTTTCNPPLNSSLPFGVNLFGYARGELGIGEDVRMLALAFKEARVPFCIINIELGANISQSDSSADGWISDQPLYPINIFCMTGIEMARYVCEKGLDFLGNRYNIGLWPWELPKWPEAWHHTWSLVDELWGISHYSAAAYSKAPVPVLPMPLPVVIGEVAKYQRKDWQLPECAYLFVFSFDMNSTLTRKNPAGLIKAFQKAFPNKGADEVGLVLKVSHLKKNKNEWRELAKSINKDDRIHLVCKELRRPEVLSLYRCCDCYVSLHRAEGFGRGLAEAQLLGLQLIATGYSGNMDFCSEPPSLQVMFGFKTLRAGDYFYGDGQVWAEPDLDHAAELMHNCLGERRHPLNYDTTRFSLTHCGQIYKSRLQQIVNRTSEKQLLEYAERG